MFKQWLNNMMATRIRIFLNPQLFLLRSGFCSHVFGVSDIRIGNFSNLLSRVTIFEYAMNWVSFGSKIRIFLFGEVTRSGQFFTVNTVSKMATSFPGSLF